MARPKFKIENKLDKRNFLKYLDNNRENILSDLESKEAFVSFCKKITSAEYILDNSIDNYFVDLTTLLYMLPDPTISRIKVSIRSMRKPNSSKGKTLLSVDNAVHSALSSFAQSNKLSLSDALSLLLKNCDRVEV
ncbi:MAG: hypothetical protein L3J43_04960 [Sulfurovum sp.]|nr:hypothetical protein [Sulfurovum sp.]